MENVVCMNEKYSLSLFVDAKDIFNQKIKLDNTNSFDSIKEKNDQVCDNIINNSWVLYNNIINNKINEEIDNRFHSIENIECNEYNENELVTHKMKTSRKTLVNFREYVISKCGNNIVNLELNNVMDKTVQKYFEKQQQGTTKNIVFNGRAPKTFVLKRLKRIGIELDSQEGVIFSDRRLNEIIMIILENPDKRTREAYHQCLKDFAKQNGRAIAGFDEMRYNLQGFSDAVKKIMENMLNNDNHAFNLGTKK